MSANHCKRLKLDPTIRADGTAAKQTKSLTTGRKKSSAALELYLLAAIHCEGMSAANLIIRVLEWPQIYAFSQFLELPNIRKLVGSAEYSGHYYLMYLFAFGTYKDYLLDGHKLPALTEPMRTKLRHLTIISLSAKHKYIPYELLLQELQIKDVLQLEELLIGAFKANVVVGKMDPLNNMLEVEQTVGREDGFQFLRNEFYRKTKYEDAFTEINSILSKFSPTR